MHHHHDPCPHCRASLPPRPSPMLGVLAISGAWVIVMAMVAGAALLGPLNIPFLPILIPGGMSLISAAHEWAAGDRICPVCGKVVEEETATASVPRFTTARAS